MYRQGHIQSHRHWPYILAGVLIVGGTLVAAGIVISKHILKSDTTLTQSQPVIKHVAGASTATQHIIKGGFSLDLPVGWQPIPAPQIVANGFSWRGTSGRDAAIRLDVYVDRLPQSLAVNRLLPVQSSGDHVDITGTVSEPCSDFTDKTPDSTKTGMALAKWDGVSFVCDMGNYERDVVATGSVEGLNTVTVTGANTGDHHVLLVYTDNNINPDFSTLTSIVRSFHAV